MTRRLVVEGLLGGSVAALALAGGRHASEAQGTPDAAAGAVIHPNMFLLTGDNAEFRFSTSSFAGQPTFTYTMPDGEVSTEGENIRIEPVLADGWPFGTLVSVYVDAAPDAWARTVTLVVPEINLVDGAETAFTTFAVLTTHFTNIGGPGFVEGQLQEYELIPLAGTASAVVF